MTATRNPARISNPFDFANPVQVPGLFVGRDSELRDVDYYLEHARSADHAINLALVGERASGKTSLLNMIEQESSRRGLCPVRIDLNEGDAENNLAFFFKVFDSILSTAVHRPSGGGDTNGLCFGGPSGKIYDTYLDMISAFSVPDDKISCPFLFPIQYAKAMARATVSAPISDQILKADFRKFAAEVATTLVLLFDECDVLSSQRVLLEMLRNIFMNLPRFMLVFTGTPRLFPVMDDVFSPIVRQFKKIEVNPFDDPRKTEECIAAPLRSSGMSELFRRSDPTHRRTMFEIHELTGGKPYEIQLVAHFMFKRIQQGMASSLQLDVDVLDVVLQELARGQNVGARSVIAGVRELNRSDLRILNAVCRCGYRGTLDQIWFCHRTLLGIDPEIREKWLEALGRFQRQGIVSVDAGRVRFLGDEFDRIYCRYLARQRKEQLWFPGLPPAFLFDSLFEEIYEAAGFTGVYLALEANDSDRVSLQDLASGPHTSSILKSNGKHVDLVYRTMLRLHLQGVQQVTFVAVDVQGPDFQYGTLLLGAQQEAENPLTQRFLADLEKCRSRATEFGSEMRFQSERIDVWDPDAMVEVALRAGNDALARKCAQLELLGVNTSYLEADGPLKVRAVERALRLNPTPKGNEANNAGYVLLAQGGAPGRAAELFNRAIETWDDSDDALPRYNRGLALAKAGQVREGLLLVREASQISGARGPEEEECLVLLEPSISGTAILLSEVGESPMLSSISSKAERVLSELVKGQQQG